MRFAYWTVMALPFWVGTALAQYECREAPAVLPHEAWSPHASASADELYRRAREALEHWSNHPALLASASEALTRLLAIEPDEARGHVELARLAMMVGSTRSYMLAPEAYDTAHSALQRALELNAESGEAWMLLAVLKVYGRDGPGGPHGNTRISEDALRQAERVGARNPRLALNWADLHALRREFDLAEQRVMQALTAPDLNSRSAGLAYRKLANYYREQRRSADASRALEDALEAEPLNPWNWVAYSAFLLEDRTDTSGAIGAARRALCLYPLSAANRRLAYALYFDWARDNLERPELRPDDRATEAYARYPNWRDVMGYAAEHENLVPLVEVLVRIGAPVDEADPHDDKSALYKAVRDGRLDDAARLIELGADANQQHEDYGSLLNVAVGELDMVRLLLEHGADVNAQWRQGTALMNATGQGDEEMVELLLSAGADPDLGDDRGETPLGVAATQSQVKIVRLLLEAGADPNHEFPPGQTIIEITRQLGLPEMATLLEQWVNERGGNESRK
jgi:tetratricopeptide (TPR) repeat protein